MKCQSALPAERHEQVAFYIDYTGVKAFDQFNISKGRYVFLVTIGRTYYEIKSI